MSLPPRNLCKEYIISRRGRKLDSYTHLLSQWDFSRNDRNPAEVAAGSSYRAHWVCDLQHRWEANVSSRTGGSGCPYCRNLKAWAGYNDLATTDPHLLSSWSVRNHLTPREVLRGSGAKAVWVCEAEGHEWEASIKSRTLVGAGCPYCAGQKVLRGFNDLESQVPALAKQWSPRNPFLPSAVHTNSSRKVWWICDLNHEWEATVYKRAVQNRGCHYCAGRKVWKGFNDLETTDPSVADEWHPTKNEEGPDEVTRHSNLKVWWKCANSHEWTTSVNHRISGTQCPHCVDLLWTSRGEREVADFVESLGTEVIRNDRKVLGGYEIDILLPTLQISIEYNGDYWHSSPQAVARDELKKRLIRAAGLVPVTIWESDWKSRPESVKLALVNLLKRGHQTSILNIPYKEI